MTSAAGGILNHGHDDRLVRRVDVDGVDVIRKRYRHADAGAVFAAMTDLWHSSFGLARQPPGLPQPLRLHDDAAGLDMGFVAGRTLGERGDTGFLPQRLHDTAALLADLHRSGVRVPRRRTAVKLVASLARKFDGDSHPVVGRLEELATELDEVLVVSHGDFSPRNVVMGPDGPVLIDFDRLQMAGAGRDVQHLAAWAWVTDVTAGHADPVGAWALGDRFEGAYAMHRPESGHELAHTRAFHRAASLVRIAMSWSALQADPAARARVLAEADQVLHVPPRDPCR